MSRDELLVHARDAAARAYSRYSKFRVGAAVLADGRLFTGCNIENASFGLTICAERAAVFNAVTNGCRRIDAIALTCVDASADAAPETRMPCGACRQVLAEFAAASVLVHVDRVRTFTVAELLPHPFRLTRPA